MIILFNEQLRLVICSSASLPLLQEAKEAYRINTPFLQIFSDTIAEGWTEKVYRQNKDVLETQTLCTYDDTILFRDESFIHAQVAITPISDENGLSRGTIMTVNDITELTLAKHRAEEAAQSKSSFLANMSHEIRTPMNAVKGLSEPFALTKLDNLQRNYINNIINSSNSLLSIINDVLDFSKIDAHKVEFIEGPYQVADVITSVCNVVNVQAEEKNLLLTMHADPSLSTSFIGDDVRLKQIITNILTNAVKYTKEGFVRLDLHVEKEGGRTCLVCSVEDSGIGIREENIPGLFDAFSRADLYANRSITGTGLGLAISKQLALAMGGDINVISSYGKGSAFTLRIPQKVMDASPIAAVRDAGKKHVLVLESGKRKAYLSSTLRALGVSFRHTDSPNTLPETGLQEYTHCIFGDGMSEETITLLRGKMPGSRFGALKDMSDAMALNESHDYVLFPQ